MEYYIYNNFIKLAQQLQDYTTQKYIEKNNK